LGQEPTTLENKIGMKPIRANNVTAAAKPHKTTSSSAEICWLGRDCITLERCQLEMEQNGSHSISDGSTEGRGFTAALVKLHGLKMSWD